MLRVLVLLLILANGLYFAWTDGLLASWGAAPQRPNEPQRVDNQLHPELLRLLSNDEVRRMEAPAARPAECLQAGLFDEKQSTVLRQVLQASFPPASWTMDSSVEPARWIVYMGKYPNADALEKKRTELRGLKVAFDTPQNASLMPGISLAGFETQAAANAELPNFVRRGVRTAHVVQERSETRGQLLKLAAVDDALRPKLDNLRTALAGKPLRPCK